MPKRSVTYRKQHEQVDEKKQYPVVDAVRILKAMGEVTPPKKYKGAKKRKGFDQTVELVMHLGIDPKQADQMIRGAVSLPKGIGATKRVIAFCPEDMAAQAKEAGFLRPDLDPKLAASMGVALHLGWLVFEPHLMNAAGYKKRDRERVRTEVFRTYLKFILTDKEVLGFGSWMLGDRSMKAGGS